MRLFAKAFRDYRSRMDLCAARRNIVKPADSAILYSSTRFLHAYTRRRVEITSREDSSKQNKVRSCVYSSPTSVADEIRTVFHSAQTRTHQRGGEADEVKQTKLTNARSKHAKPFRNAARRAVPNKWARRNILTYAYAYRRLLIVAIRHGPSLQFSKRATANLCSCEIRSL